MARIIVYAVFGGFGLVMLYVGLTQFFLQRRLMTHARPVPSVITHSEVFVSKSSDTDTRINRDNSTTSYRPDVKFRYRVEGVEYESDLLHPNIIVQGYASRESAAEALAPYPIGAEVTAYVDPANPDKAFLVREKSAGPVVFIVLGVLLPPVAWFASRLV